MNISFSEGLPPRQAQAIDQLYSLILKSKDLSDFITLELGSITNSLKRSCGAMNLLNPFLKIEPKWIKYNIPENWESQLANPQSRLNKDALEVYSTQTPLDENPQLNIAGIVPITSHGNTIGVLVLGGDPLSAEDIDFANLLLSIFTRILLSEMHVALHWRETKDKNIIKTLSSAIREINSNPNQATLDLMKGLRTYYNSEYILIIQKDLETPELIIKKLLGSGDEWIYQINQHVSPELFDKLTFPEKPDEVQSLSANNDLILDILDLPGVDIQSVTYVPIIIRSGVQIGAMVFFNRKYPLYEVDKELLLQYANLLADLLENWNSIQMLKIDLAKLESKKMEILHSRDVLREIFDNMQDSIYIIDTSYTILALNISRSSRIGVHPAKLMGKTCYEVFYNRHTPCPACRAGETLTQAMNTARTWREWTSSETHLEWEIHTFPVFDEMHIPIQVIIQETDNTEKRNLEENLIQSEKLAAVGQLAAGIAHEINNPLAAIIANAQLQLQLSTDDPPDKLEALKLIETAGIRASNVVRNLLNISRKENLGFEPTDINETIKSALLLINHEILKLNLEIITDYGEDMPLLLGQRENLQGVWINLILNAVDAIAVAEREKGMIRITTSYSNSEFHILVEDNGKGITQERIKNIFEPFYTTKKAGHGTGLGLSVCLRTIKEHNGTINVESQIDQGTKFLINIPMRADDISE